MGYTKGHVDLDASQTNPGLSGELQLKNLGLSVYVLGRGEGYDFFHSHREQEEIYFCLEGSVDLVVKGTADATPESVSLARGDVVRVEPQTLRAFGNLNSDRAVVLIAGACSHTYPAGFGYHDVIADVLTIEGQGKTGFRWPKGIERRDIPSPDDDC